MKTYGLKLRIIKIFFAVIYRHPNFNFWSFEKSSSHNFLVLENKKLLYIVSGDMNINYLATDNFRVILEFSVIKTR